MNAPPLLKRERRLVHALLAGALLVGTALRFYALGAKSLWVDEAFSVWLARQSAPELIDWVVRIDQHPPLYYLLLHVWIRLLGDGPVAVRSLSALAGALTLPVFYLIARRVGPSRRTALPATLLLALSPFHIRYAQEARMYALLTLFAATAIYGAVSLLAQADKKSVNSKEAIPAVCLLLTGQVAAMWTHNTAAVFLPAALLIPLLVWKTTPAFRRVWLGVQGLALLLWLPWLLGFMRQARGVDARFWLPAPTPGRMIDALETFAFAHLPDGAWRLPLLALMLSLAGAGVWSLRRQPRRRILLLSLWLTPIAGELLISLRRPIFSAHTLIWTTLPFYLFIGLGVQGATSRKWSESPRSPASRSALGLSLTAAIAFISLAGVAGYFQQFEKEDWRGAARAIAQEAQPGDLLLFHASWVQLPFDYYFRHEAATPESRGLPADLFDRGELEPVMEPGDLPRLQTLVDRRDRVWLLYAHDWYTDPDGLIPAYMEQTMQLVGQTELQGLQIFEYEQKAEERQ
ncbi:MAG: glycosyltransferase family 39 protein [Caldilineaceae bacterium]|nr:glycosyltransferase family 39 protein [Caldilineaceae bacterium]